MQCLLSALGHGVVLKRIPRVSGAVFLCLSLADTSVGSKQGWAKSLRMLQLRLWSLPPDGKLALGGAWFGLPQTL